MADTTKDLNAWLQYTIHPQRLTVTPRSAPTGETVSSSSWPS